MANTDKFNKELAYDELIRTIRLGDKPSMSDFVKAIELGRDFLQKIYDQGIQVGFEAGCQATKEVDNLDTKE